MPAPSKYAENQFLTATERRLPLMGEILADTEPKLLAAAAENPTFDIVVDLLEPIFTAWNAAETSEANAEAGQKSATLALEDKLESLQRKPDADTNSLLETWDITIRGQVAFQGTTYTLLLPRGRETLTDGKLGERLDALRDFGIRLSQQTGKPVLVTLGVTVTAFYNQALALRTTQNGFKTTLEEARRVLEEKRVEAGQALFGMAGFGMWTWRDDETRVDSLYDVNLLRDPVQDIPAPPADTLWTPATRLLGTTALPVGATRLDAWRLGPGGAPERLATGEREATAVLIPADITFTPGLTYQLWLTARNSRGPSDPSPAQTWVAG